MLISAENQCEQHITRLIPRKNQYTLVAFLELKRAFNNVEKMAVLVQFVKELLWNKCISSEYAGVVRYDVMKYMKATMGGILLDTNTYYK